MHFYLLAWHRFTDFRGRSERGELWWFLLVNWAVWLTLGAVGGLLGWNWNLFSTLFFLAALVPSLAVMVRRLHDVGHSGWLLLLGLIPVLGWLPLLYWSLKPGDAGFNQFGQSPVGMLVSNAKAS